MKIVFIASEISIHTRKWASSFSKDNEVYVITQQPDTSDIEKDYKVYTLFFKGKIGYFFNALQLHILIKKINPEIINVHYASGYGTLARVAHIGKYLLNVWGSDVFDFPYESKFKMQLIKQNLHAAHQIASTSYVMKKQVENLITPKRDIVVTPFGIDTSIFSPKKKEMKDCFIVGTVKTLSPIYGISTLIRAYNYAYENGLQNSKLLLVGDGEQRIELQALANMLPSSKNIEFIGSVQHTMVPLWLNKFNIYCALSESESFGVAVVEAESCGIPVIVSDVGGLPEVVVNNVSGYIVPRNDYVEAGEAILKLAKSPDLQKKMGEAGRNIATTKFNWTLCVEIMKELFQTCLRK